MCFHCFNMMSRSLFKLTFIIYLSQFSRLSTEAYILPSTEGLISSKEAEQTFEEQDVFKLLYPFISALGTGKQKYE